VFFEGFTLEHVSLSEVTLRVRHGGSGPPVVLLHGHPRTHATWHRVAPLLAERHTVVCPDLRGYGQSSKPPTTDDHAPYSKRAMAGDIVELMGRLGHDRFALAGHDRGTYVAFRLALDHPEAVTHFAGMDGVPILDALERCDARFAQEWFHWFFFGQPAPRPETVVSRDPDWWYRTEGKEKPMGRDAFEDYMVAIHDPDTVHAMIEDYRAGLGIDREHDAADRAAGRQVQCPTLIVWALRDDMEKLYGDPLAVWRPWIAGEPQGLGIECGHHIAEEAPEELAAALLRLLA
jgi:haloacetate dehalogenase